MRDSQYQNKKIRDWAAHLKDLQSILLKFDIKGAPNKDDLICHFREGLKPFIRSEIEQLDKQLDVWDVLVQKAIALESKAGL